MKRFFHVDRNGGLQEGQEINFVKFYEIKPDELQDHFNVLYPEGFSNWGINFLLNYANNTDSLTEILFDYVRRSCFKERPSRFQSVFAFDNIEQAKDFRYRFNNSIGNIWEIEANNFFKADMNLLDLKSFKLMQLDYHAHLYWKGETIGNPYWEYLLVPPVKVIRKVDG